MVAKTSKKRSLGTQQSNNLARGALCGKHFTKKNVSLLLVLSQCGKDGKTRKALLKHIDKDAVKCICECILNILHGSVEIAGTKKKLLNRYRHLLRELATPKRASGWHRRKKILLQSGGSFLPLLLSPLIEVLVSKLLG